MNSTVKKKVNFINSTQNEGLSPSCIALSFDGFGSISWHPIWVLSALSHFFSRFPTFRPEHHWRDLIRRNAHLVYQNWYRISFTSYLRFLLRSVLPLPSALCMFLAAWKNFRGACCCRFVRPFELISPKLDVVDNKCSLKLGLVKQA
jgi:hypothetical protein